MGPGWRSSRRVAHLTDKIVLKTPSSPQGDPSQLRGCGVLRRIEPGALLATQTVSRQPLPGGKHARTGSLGADRRGRVVRRNSPDEGAIALHLSVLRQVPGRVALLLLQCFRAVRGGHPGPRVGDLAYDNGVRLHELASAQASLEEAFMELTGAAVEFRAHALPPGRADGGQDERVLTGGGV